MNETEKQARANRERGVLREEGERMRKLFPGMSMHIVTRDDVEKGFTEEMRWKNFVIGNEIEIAASMVYGACQTWMTTARVERDTESRIYAVLYGWSAGLERLGKALLALKGAEHSFLKKSINHSHRKLWKELESRMGNQPRDSFRLMELCEIFYNQYRYSGINDKAESQRDVAKLAWQWLTDIHPAGTKSQADEVRNLTDDDRRVTIGSVATYGGWLVRQCWAQSREQGLFLDDVPSWYKSKQLQYEGESGRNGMGIILEPYLKNAVITEIEERIEGTEKEESWLGDRTPRELMTLWMDDEVLFDIRDGWEEHVLEYAENARERGTDGGQECT